MNLPLPTVLTVSRGFCSADDSFMDMSPIPDSKCSYKCTGDSSATCSVYDAINVYQV